MESEEKLPHWDELPEFRKMIIRAEIQKLARREPPLSPTAIANQISGQFDVIVPVAVALALAPTP
jgi:hypothetical protein